MMSRLGGRFVLERRLKQGNGVETHAGVDERTGARVVVKTVHSPDVPAAVRYRLVHEASVLQRLSARGARRGCAPPRREAGQHHVSDGRRRRGGVGDADRLRLGPQRGARGVVQRLLAKEPSQRYQSAQAARDDLEEIAAELARGVTEPAVTPGSRDRRDVLTEPAFVGRESELQTLAGLVDGTRDGTHALVLVEAESGGGKSRVLDEVAAHAAHHDLWVRRGQGIDQAGQRPFQVLDGIATAIVARASTDASFGAALRAHLGDRAEAIVAALPGLASALGTADPSPVGPEAYGETRSVDALAWLLAALGAAGQPVAVLLDDCQWADTLSVSVVGRWKALAEAAAAAVLVVAAFRILCDPPRRSHAFQR